MICCENIGGLIHLQIKKAISGFHTDSVTETQPKRERELASLDILDSAWPVIAIYSIGCVKVISNKKTAATNEMIAQGLLK